eukprot:TCONS_00017558-protein
MDPKRTLPDELFEKVLQEVEIEDFKTINTVCKSWKNFVEGDWALWKYHCKNLDQTIVEKDAQKNTPWKDILKRNYGKNGVLRRWEEGLYSNMDCFVKQPDDFICELDLAMWGYLLDLVC